MLSSFLSTLATFVTNKKILGAWLVLLTLSTSQMGEKVFVREPTQHAIIDIKLETIQRSLTGLQNGLDRNEEKLNLLLQEQARVKAELRMLRESQVRKR